MEERKAIVKFFYLLVMEKFLKDRQSKIYVKNIRNTYRI